MDRSKEIKISKFLSFVLRHHPESIGLEIDKEGWANIQSLIECSSKNGRSLSREVIKAIVEKDEKKRYAFSPDGLSIRAVQGHSAAQVDMSFEETSPPTILYHGTATRNVGSIMENGLLPSSRQYVHLSADQKSALTVGKRHGKPIVLKIKAREMQLSNFKFFQAENGVWLTKTVPKQFIERT